MSFIGLGLSYLSISLIGNIYLNIGLIFVLSIALGIISYNLHNKNLLFTLLDYISNINDLDFDLNQVEGIPSEAIDNIEKLYKNIRGSLKTQVEISTEIFNIVEELALSTSESLESTKLINSSMAIADNNIVEQNTMLKSTNQLSEEIYSSMETIEGEVNGKIEFISSCILNTQSKLQDVQLLEERILNSTNMVEESSIKIRDLRNYFDEVVKFVDLINNISSQTTMLSLNASIEAARAGEEGRGFAIVAAEVGKLASETENVSKKIEEVIKSLTLEINSISHSMNNEMIYMAENSKIMKSTNREFNTLVDTLNLGMKSLEDIKDHTKENTKLTEEINLNIEKIFESSDEITRQFANTNELVFQQHKKAENLNESAEVIRSHVYNMQQFVVGKAMEEKMLTQAYQVRDYFINKDNISDREISNLLRDIGVDAIYVTDSKGLVEYTNEKSAMGLDLYKADPTFLQFKDKDIEYLVTPIKKRVEDGKLFKFLTVSDSKGRLYEVGLGLYSMLNTI